MVYHEADLSVLWLPSQLEYALRKRGIKTVGQVMDLPAYLSYEEVYCIPEEQASILRYKIREYIKNEGSKAPLSDQGVAYKQAVHVEESVSSEAPLEYPSNEDTESDKAYQAGYRAGWQAAVQVIRKSLDAVDTAVAEGMDKGNR